MSESESVAIASASQPSNPPEVNVNNTSSENNVEGGESNGDNHVEEKENEEPKEIVATKVSGTVKWFNVKSGYGFINRNDTKEDVFVHQTAIQKNNPKKAVRSVGDGEIVEFDVVIGEKGNEASNVCGPEGAPVKGSPYAADRRRGTGFRRGRGGAEGAPAPAGVVVAAEPEAVAEADLRTATPEPATMSPCPAAKKERVVAEDVAAASRTAPSAVAALVPQAREETWAKTEE